MCHERKRESLAMRFSVSFRFTVKGIILFWIAFIALGIPFSYAAGDILSKIPRPLASVINFGEDFTRPLARFDVRLKYQNKGDGSDALVNTYRMDYPFRLKNGWNIATRVDLPMVVCSPGRNCQRLVAARTPWDISSPARLRSWTVGRTR